MAVRKTSYGYILANGSIAVNTEEAEVVRRIFADRISGLSGVKIGAALYAGHIEPFTESEKQAADRVYMIAFKYSYNNILGVRVGDEMIFVVWVFHIPVGSRAIVLSLFSHNVICSILFLGNIADVPFIVKNTK